jgi:aquaporin Z
MQYQGEKPIEPEFASVMNCSRFHWPEYLMEAAEVALFQFLICVFSGLLFSPTSPIRQVLHRQIELRALMGLAVGMTVVAIVRTPWGQRSGGHFNPAVTVAFYRLGKMDLLDALFYLLAQFSGAIAGVCPVRFLFPDTIGGGAARYAVTAPGVQGTALAFVAELAISFVLMLTILVASNRESLARYTPYLVGILYVIFITLESPLSGMSMNPARSFGPALHAWYWHAIWLYFAAPTLGMLVAAEMFLRGSGGFRPLCAKLHHANNKRCIFRHGIPVAIGRGGGTKCKMTDQKLARLPTLARVR